MTTGGPLRDAELWRAVLDARLSDVHTAMPGKVISFDAAAQTIEVQPQIKNVIVGEEADEEESYPRLYNVPVIYPRSGNAMVVFPLAAGDIVTLVFHEWPIDAFREKGAETHPIELERHTFAGAVAFPGGPFPAASPVQETVDAMMVGYDGGALVKVKSDGTIEASSTAGAKQFVALDQKTKNEITALRNFCASFSTFFDAHTHPETGVTTSPPLPLFGTAPPAVGNVGSTKVKAEE